MHLKSLASDYCALDMMQGKWICFSFQILRISGPRPTPQENTLFKKKKGARCCNRIDVSRIIKQGNDRDSGSFYPRLGMRLKGFYQNILSDKIYATMISNNRGQWYFAPPGADTVKPREERLEEPRPKAQLSTG